MELPRLPLPQVCPRRIAKPHSCGREGECGGRLRVRDIATVRGLFLLFPQITDRPRKMRQYRLNRKHLLLYRREINREHPAGIANLTAMSSRRIHTTHSAPPATAPAPQKMKPQPRFKALAGIFYRGFYAGTSQRL